DRRGASCFSPRNHVNEQPPGPSLSSQKPRVLEPGIPFSATELVGNDEEARGPNTSMPRDRPKGGGLHLDRDDPACDQLASSRARLSIHRVDGPRSAGTKSTGPALQNGGNRAPEVSVGSECACFPIEPRGPLVRNRKGGKHEVPDHKVRDEGAARAEGEKGPATQSGHLFHRDDRSGSPDRGSSDDNGSHSRGPYTQPPIPTLPLSMDRAVEGPEIAGREHDDADPRKMRLCATQPQGCPQITEKMFRTNDELGLSHRTTAYSRRAPSPSRSIRSKRRRGAASSEVTPWPPASVGAAWPPSTRLLTKTFSSSARPFRRKDQMTVLPP